MIITFSTSSFDDGGHELFKISSKNEIFTSDGAFEIAVCFSTSIMNSSDLVVAFSLILTTFFTFVIGIWTCFFSFTQQFSFEENTIDVSIKFRFRTKKRFDDICEEIWLVVLRTFIKLRMKRTCSYKDIRWKTNNYKWKRDALAIKFIRAWQRKEITSILRMNMPVTYFLHLISLFHR